MVNVYESNGMPGVGWANIGAVMMSPAVYQVSVPPRHAGIVVPAHVHRNDLLRCVIDDSRDLHLRSETVIGNALLSVYLCLLKLFTSWQHAVF